MTADPFFVKVLLMIKKKKAGGLENFSQSILKCLFQLQIFEMSFLIFIRCVLINGYTKYMTHTRLVKELESHLCEIVVDTDTNDKYVRQ